MNMRQINEVRDGARAKIRQVREENKGNDSDCLVMVIDRQESIPRALLLDRSVSAGAVRAYGVLLTHSPTIFPGMRSLGIYLGGGDGAVRTTDELFLGGWITKEVVREGGKQQSLGTIYVCLPSRMEPSEMAALDCGWVPFVVRLAHPSTSKNDKKAALRRRAAAIIEVVPGLFRGVFTIAESENAESEIVNQSSSSKEDSSKKKIFLKETGGKAAVKENAPAAPRRLSFKNEFGFQWSSSWDRFLDEKRAVAIMKKLKISDAGLARHVMGEWAAEAVRGFQNDDPAGALVWLCRRAVAADQPPLGLSRQGEEMTPEWVA